MNSYIATHVKEMLAENNMTLVNGTLLYSSPSGSYPEKEIKDRVEPIYCVTTRPQILLKDLIVNVTAASSSSISLVLSQPSNTLKVLTATVQGPISAVATGYLYANGRAEEQTGWDPSPFGPIPHFDYVERETWSTGFKATTSANVSITVSLGLQTKFDRDQKVISVTPNVSMAGEVLSINSWNIDPYDPSLPSLFDLDDINRSIDEIIFRDLVNDTVTKFLLEKEADDKLKDKLKKVVADLNDQVGNSLAGQGATCIDTDNTGSVDKCTLSYKLPEIDFNNLDPASQALLKSVLDYINSIHIVGELALDVIKSNWTEILFYVLTDNRAALEQLLMNLALCPGLEQLKAKNMSATSLYSTASGTCAAVDPRTPGAGPFYATENCQTKIGFQTENFNDFCNELFAARPNSLLGNPVAWTSTHVETDALSMLPDPSSKWSLSSAAQFAAGVEPISDNHIPFMKRINYRQVGDCALEMRVYKKNISDTNLTPVLMIHGGSWTYRSAGFLGTESLISNYTEDNFVVFAPFYRLIGDKDGNQECRNATWENTVADVEAALDWVMANGAAYGASDAGKIAVTGQSAGAHLAGWLMTHRPTQVSSGLLFYPPTDVIDFLTRLQGVGGAAFPPLSDSAGTPYDPSSAQEIIETYLSLPSGSAQTVDLTNPASYLSENSFARKIGNMQSAYPPAFIVQGMRDSLLTYSQSQALCESYGGEVNVDWSATPDGLRAIYPCGDRSWLHLFKEADHAFEVCPFTDIASACRAGSAESAALLIDSLQKGRQWLLSKKTCPDGYTPNSENGGCEGAPKCDAGVYYPALDICASTQTSAATCPSGLTLNSTTDRCEAVVGECFPGYAKSGDECVSIGVWQSDECDYDSNDCWGTVTDTCDGNDMAEYVCSAGTTKTCRDVANLWQDDNEDYLWQYRAVSCMSVPAVCPSGSTLNTTTNRCETAPICNASVYDPVTDVCVAYASIAPSCLAGTLLNPKTDLCESMRGCSAGYNRISAECFMYYGGANATNFSTDTCDGYNDEKYIPVDGVTKTCTDIYPSGSNHYYSQIVDAKPATSAACPSGTTLVHRQFSSC